MILTLKQLICLYMLCVVLNVLIRCKNLYTVKVKVPISFSI